MTIATTKIGEPGTEIAHDMSLETAGSRDGWRARYGFRGRRNGVAEPRPAAIGADHAELKFGREGTSSAPSSSLPSPLLARSSWAPSMPCGVLELERNRVCD